MKQLSISLMLCILGITAFSQSEKYVAAMKKNIARIDSSFAKPDVFLDLSNTFERIGSAEKTQWLPYYYAALCRVNYALVQQDKAGNDAIAEKASALLDIADSLSKKNSEISTLRSMVATVRMTVDPMSRYMEYGKIIEDELQTAISQDASNPRPYLIRGQNLKYTPVNFGGGCKTALPVIQTAVQKFAAFKPASDIAPQWGSAYADSLVKECTK